MNSAFARAGAASRVARMLALCACAVGAWACAAEPAQRVAAAASPASQQRHEQAQQVERQAQRRELRSLQERLDRDYAADRAQCMRRFAVFDCLDAAARRHRERADALRARERHLDLLDREQRARQEREGVRERLAQRHGEDAQRAQRERQRRMRRELQAQQTLRERTRTAASAAGRAPAPPAAHPARVKARGAFPAKPPGDQQPLQTASEARAAQARRQRREEDYRRLQQRAQQQRGNASAPALPVPPPSGPLVLPR